MVFNYIKKKKILLVDDEPDLLEMVFHILHNDSFSNIKTALNMQEALSVFKEYEPDLALLDIMLPDGDGFSLMQKIRKTSDIPVIFLTAKDTHEDLLQGLGAGADDYIAKPFLPDELLLRISQLLKRSYKEDNPTVKLKGCSIDLSNACVLKNGKEYQLTAKEFALIETLIRNANRIVSIDTLCIAAWGDNPFGYEGSLQTHIRRIREKIEQTPSAPVSLVTIKGLGYKLIVPGR